MKGRVAAISKAVGIGTAVAWSVAALGFLRLWHIGAFSPSYEAHGFARRWPGECTCAGWDIPLALGHVVADLGQWWAYVVIAVVVHRLHPVPSSIKTARASVFFTSAFFVMCGFGHGFQAYTVFDPAYDLELAVDIVTLGFAAPGCLLIASSLVTAFHESEKRRRELARLKSEGKR